MYNAVTWPSFVKADLNGHSHSLGGSCFSCSITAGISLAGSLSDVTAVLWSSSSSSWSSFARSWINRACADCARSILARGVSLEWRRRNGTVFGMRWAPNTFSNACCASREFCWRTWSKSSKLLERRMVWRWVAIWLRDVGGAWFTDIKLTSSVSLLLRSQFDPNSCSPANSATAGRKSRLVSTAALSDRLVSMTISSWSAPNMVLK